MSADPLAFFAANDSDEDSEDEDLVEANHKKESDSSCETNSAGDTGKLLPPPLAALATAKTPEFVTKHLRTDMDWDKMVKEAPYVPPKEFKPWETALPSVENKSKVRDHKPDLAIVKQVPNTITSAPPKSDPSVAKERPTNMTDHAISWSKMYKSSNFDGGSVKRPRPEDDDQDLVGFCHTDTQVDKVAFQMKHQKTSSIKTQSFKEKEKRKRDTGQANREKMFVEEEKRILRQNFAVDG